MDRQQRLDELRVTSRCGDGAPETALDCVSGLIDLLECARPKSALTIGAAKGVSTEVFLLHCDRVTVVDPWEDSPEHLDLLVERCRPYSHLTVIRGFSPEALGGLGSSSYDLVYVDAVHVYQPLIDDVRASFRLVREDGWIAGHDYWSPNNDLDVIPAVDALFGRDNIQVFSDGSWLARRPSALPDTPPASGKLLLSPSIR